MDRPTPPGLSGCVCAACWRVFGSPSAFDRHQRLDATGAVCRDPAELAMHISREHRGHPVWTLRPRPA